MEKSILLADDHAVVRSGLRVWCEHYGLKDIDDASSCEEIMTRLKNKVYSHLILDLSLSDGITLKIIPAIRQLYPHLRIMIFSVQAEDIYENALAKYGIYYFITKASPEKDSIQLVRKFLNNQELKRPFNKIDKESPLMNLAPRELQVTHYLLSGSSVNEIAASLNLKQTTVSTIKHRIFEKCRVDNVVDLKELTINYSQIEGSKGPLK